MDEDLEPVVDLVQVVLTATAGNDTRTTAEHVVDALVRTRGAAYQLAIAHSDHRAQEGG